MPDDLLKLLAIFSVLRRRAEMPIASSRCIGSAESVPADRPLFCSNPLVTSPSSDTAMVLKFVRLVPGGGERCTL